MTSSEATRQALRERARQLIAEGYERASVVDASRADELVETYREIGQDVVVVRGAIPDETQECEGCLDDPDLVTLFVKRRA